MFIGRHRSRTAWFEQKAETIWRAPDAGPPVVVFYSFKGGLGRTTALTSFAIQRAQAGERVCVLDFDLDSPGIGLVLSASTERATAVWGVVDFLLEHRTAEPPFGDYYHRCDRVAGAGEIAVLPAGTLNEAYLDKLARVDLEEAPTVGDSGISALLTRVRDELKPNWILVDARTGISEPAGQLLSGIAHLHVLFGSAQDQSWQGLNQVIDRLGKERLNQGWPQAEIILVQAMVPTGEAGRIAKRDFLARAQGEFTDRYYLESDANEEATAAFWDTRDADSFDAPHSAVAIAYDARLASFGDVTDIADSLKAEPFQTLADRIMNRFIAEPMK
jgi:hypothetical protein